MNSQEFLDFAHAEWMKLGLNPNIPVSRSSGDELPVAALMQLGCAYPGGFEQAMHDRKWTMLCRQGEDSHCHLKMEFCS